MLDWINQSNQQDLSMKMFVLLVLSRKPEKKGSYETTQDTLNLPFT